MSQDTPCVGTPRFSNLRRRFTPTRRSQLPFQPQDDVPLRSYGYAVRDGGASPRSGLEAQILRAVGNRQRCGVWFRCS